MGNGDARSRGGVLKFWGFAGQQKDGNAPRDR